MILVTLALVGLTGCAGLVIKPEDTWGNTTAKVGARTLLWPLTLGASEGVMSGTKLELGLRAQVGKATYDDVIQQLGPPVSVASGVGVTVADWQSWHSMGPIWFLIECVNPAALLKPMREVGAFEMTERLTFDEARTLRAVEMRE